MAMSDAEVQQRAQILHELEAKGTKGIYMDDPQVTRIFKQRFPNGVSGNPAPNPTPSNNANAGGRVPVQNAPVNNANSVNNPDSDVDLTLNGNAQKKGYRPIGKMLPEDDQKSIDFINGQNKQRMSDMAGKLIRVDYLNNPSGVPQKWELRNIQGTPQYVRIDRSAPNSRLIFRNPDGTESAPVNLGGDDYADTITNKRKWLADNHPENPLTGKDWTLGGKPVDVSTANAGQLTQMLKIAKRAGGKDLDTYQKASINGAGNVQELLRDVERQYVRAGGRGGLNKFSQAINNLDTETAFSHWANMSGPDSDARKAFLNLQTDLMQLKKANVDIGRLSDQAPAGQAGGVATNVNGILSSLINLKGGVYGALLGPLVNNVLDSAKEMVKGDFDSDSLKYQTTLAKHQVDNTLRMNVIDLAKPSGAPNMDDSYRRYYKVATNDLADDGVGPNDDIREKSNPIPEPGEEGADQKAAGRDGVPVKVAPVVGGTGGTDGTKTGTDGQKPATDGQKSATPTKEEDPEQQGFGMFWNAVKGIWQSVAGAGEPDIPGEKPAAKPEVAQKPGAKPAVTPTNQGDKGAEPDTALDMAKKANALAKAGVPVASPGQTSGLPTSSEEQFATGQYHPTSQMLQPTVRRAMPVAGAAAGAYPNVEALQPRPPVIASPAASTAAKPSPLPSAPIQTPAESPTGQTTGAPSSDQWQFRTGQYEPEPEHRQIVDWNAPIDLKKEFLSPIGPPKKAAGQGTSPEQLATELAAKEMAKTAVPAGQVTGAPSASEEEFATGKEPSQKISAKEPPKGVVSVGGMDVPHLHNQDDVDNLDVGDPFYWQDHPDPYMKVA
jgi:hypothetical protein